MEVWGLMMMFPIVAWMMGMEWEWVRYRRCIDILGLKASKDAVTQLAPALQYILRRGFTVREVE